MPSIIGLDLGKHTFRAIELDRSKRKLSIIHSGTYENPKINFADEDPSAEDSYSTALKNFIREHSFTTTKVVLALEEKDVFMRVISLPKMSDKELKSSIMYEAEQYIPLPLKEVRLDFQKLDLPNEPKGKMSVELVAAKTNVLQKYVDIVKEANLTPIALEPEALAIARALAPAKGSNETLLIVHLGYEKSLIIITLKGQVVFTRTLSIGGYSMTKAIEQGLNLDYNQAEEYKKAYGLNKDQADGKIFEVLLPTFNNLVSEIGRAQVFFTSRHSNVNINRVILSGGSALMPGLMYFMATNLNLEVELANPFKNLNFAKSLENDKEWHVKQGPLFTTPIGLALKEF